ncbi:MAG: NAD-binding protein [Candidatus Cloacimonetes bacterium]|nr:NAD-binding protein [Candidatus Cloacimonadota bacterium]
MAQKKRRNLLRRIARTLRPGTANRRFIIIGVFIIMLIATSSAVIWYLEAVRSPDENLITSLADGIWWSIVTITTVGYGDEVPVTPIGRIVGVGLILVGFISFSSLTGLIASMMVEEKLKGARGLKPIKDRGHAVVCGWNDTALIMLQTFADKEIDETIVLVGNHPTEFFGDLEAKFPGLKLRFVRGDYALKEILQRAGVSVANQVFVLADENLPQQGADDRSIIVASAVRFLSKTVPLTVQLVHRDSRTHLDNCAVDNIVIFGELGGNLLANNVLNQHYLAVVESLLQSRDHGIETVKIPATLAEQTFGDLVQWFYEERGKIVMGILSERPRLELTDIFSDDSSTIDDFIRSALEQSSGKLPDQRWSIQIKPNKDYRLQPNDSALVLS